MVYDKVTVSTDKPVTAPVVLLMVATELLLLAHVPPMLVSLIVVVAPRQMAVSPLIAPTTGKP